jgi:aminoglycoside 3-N-acetyltransferase
MGFVEKERTIVEKTDSPITKGRLVQDLKTIGVETGNTIVVHSSMSKIGWVVGGQTTVVQALMEAVSEKGTIVMPAHTAGNTDPKNWSNPPVPEDWWATIRDEMPPFQPEITPLRGLGRIPRLFRTMPRVVRSSHPQVSCSAWGRHAAEIVKEHELERAYSDRSPWGALYRLDAKILLLGVDHNSNTALHHAETKASTPETPTQSTGAAVLENGERKWVTWIDLDYGSDDLQDCGAAFEETIGYKPSKIGQAESRLLAMRPLIDFAIGWFTKNR